jgi:hypothetical protein
MEILKKIASLLIVLAAVVFLLGVLTAFRVIPPGSLILTTGGFERIADTLLLFSISIGLCIIVWRKK